MMWDSDNFFAEQTLLMAANEGLGAMRDDLIIGDLLHGDLHDLPQKPLYGSTGGSA